MKERLFLFGLGTGRCGTVSLAKLLNAQKSALVTHEARPWLPWKLNSAFVADKSVELLDKAEKFGVDIVGDVALFNLQSVEALLALIPNAKFVILQRDQEDTVDSFKRKWRSKYNRLRIKKTEWDYVFPHYDQQGAFLVDDVNRYYTEYYAKAFVLQKKYPQNVKCFSTQVLNSEVGVKSILDFCRVPDEIRVYRVGIKANKGNKV